MATGGKTLQQSRSLSHRTSRLVTPRPRVGIKPCLVGLKGCPIDEAGMMVRNENRPLSDGQMTHPLLDDALFINVAFAPALAVGVSASIHRIGEDVVECSVSRRDPADRTRLHGG